jgi:subtilisin family serine protease
VIGCEHGTHVAGIAAGRRGVARGANIIAIQTTTQVNSQQLCGDLPTPCTQVLLSDQIRALDYVYSMNGRFNVAAVNMSLGAGRHGAACSRELTRPFIDNLHTAGIATVVASGNYNYTNAISSPACVSKAVSVGATNKRRIVTNFSNSSRQLDLLAPGSRIISSVPGLTYAALSGTSQAAPHVAGAFAVLNAAAPWANVDMLLATLKYTGTPVIDGRNNLTRSFIRVDRALNSLNH